MRPGDSLIRIAFMFDNSVTLIKKMNDLHSDEIYPGQILYLLDNKKENSHLL